MAINRKKSFLRRHRIALFLALTLAVFGIVGALVVLAPRTESPPPPESKGSAPKVRQIERQSL